MNICIFTGRLGRDPEVSSTKAGKQVVNFSLAVDAGKDSQGNKLSHWFDFVAWESTAQTIAQYCHKGDQITVESRAGVEEFQGKDGVRRRAIKFTVNRMHFGQKAGGNQGAPRQAQPPAQYDERAAFEQAAQSGAFDAPPQHHAEEQVPF